MPEPKSVIALYPEHFGKWFTPKTRCLVDRRHARWSDVEADLTKALLDNAIPVDVIAKSLGRSPDSIRTQVSDGFTDLAVHTFAFQKFWDEVVEHFLSGTSTYGKDHPIMRTPPLFVRYFTLYLGCAENDAEGWVELEEDSGLVKEKAVEISETIWGCEQGSLGLDIEPWNWKRFKVNQVQTLELPVQLEPFENEIGAAFTAGMSYLETGLLLMFKETTIHDDLKNGVIPAIPVQTQESKPEEEKQQGEAQTVVSKYVMHLVSQLRHLIIPGSDRPRLTGALLSNPNLMDLIIHMDVDLIVSYVERVLNDLACDHRSGTAVSLMASLLSNPSLMSMVRQQQYLDDEAERSS